MTKPATLKVRAADPAKPVIMPPVDGVIRRGPDGFPVAIRDEWTEVPNNLFWRQRLADGDCVATPADESVPPAPAEEPEAAGGVVLEAQPVEEEV